jgi:membrane-bound lytic murein transglycosylase B
MRKRLLISWMLGMLISMASAAQHGEQRSDWERWVQELRHEALAKGIRPEIFDTAFRGVHPSKRVQHFERSQPEKRLTYGEYRQSRIDPYRITLGRREYKKHQVLLEKIGAQYQVNPCVITALWGMESSYGRFRGDFPVIASLATLAYEGRRKSFFRSELFLALKIVNDQHVSLANFKGEWAGASGQTQFLPSSWYKYAVDYNGDGRKDIWNTLDDVLASIANYLKKNQWHDNEPWVVETTLPEDFDENLFGVENKRSLSEWLELGVEVPEHLPSHLQAAIIMPHGGPALLAFHNFNVIKTYNNSTFYAGSVGYLADKICSEN